MKSKFSKILASLLIIVMALSLSGCGKDENKGSGKKNNTEVKEPDNKQLKIVDTSSKSRPYAVMINNINVARPLQSGLQDAYLMYEIIVEGGITRYMALFMDQNTTRIGSIRSARHYFLDYDLENDAIYAHAGGAQDAIERIRKEKINDVDVDGKYGFRDKTLDRAWEHKLFTSTKQLKEGAEAKGYSLTTNIGNLLNYSAEDIDTSKFEGSSVAKNVSVKYSSYRTSNYVYDETTKTYLRSMNDTKNTDLVTGKQYTVKNIIVYSVKYSNYTHHGYSAYVKTDNVGTGEGYYISNGYSIPITWTKPSKNEKTVYKIKSTGEELVVNDGNTYIQIYPTSGKLTME